MEVSFLTESVYFLVKNGHGRIFVGEFSCYPPSDFLNKIYESPAADDPHFPFIDLFIIRSLLRKAAAGATEDF